MSLSPFFQYIIQTKMVREQPSGAAHNQPPLENIIPGQREIYKKMLVLIDILHDYFF